MKRALMFATTASMIQQFNMDNIRLLQELGYDVDVACNLQEGNSISSEKVNHFVDELEQMGICVYDIPISRSIINLKAWIRSIAISRNLMNENNYALVHCHTPIGSVVCRVANRLSQNYKKTRMVYTAHGFHFFKGAPLQNWMFYYPIEKICSRFTDVIVTINREDYSIAKNKMHAKKVVHIPGVGIDVDHIMHVAVDKEMKRSELGIPQNAFVVLSVGELNKNKNHRAVLRAISLMNREDIHYVIAGKGKLEAELQALSKQLGIGDRLHLLGYRTDIIELMKMSDLFVFPSLREGLPVSLMEAMACGLPCIVTDTRGNRDLIDKQGGFILPVEHFDEMLGQCLSSIDDYEAFRENCKVNNQSKVEKYSRKVVEVMMRDIYGA